MERAKMRFSKHLLNPEGIIYGAKDSQGGLLAGRTHRPRADRLDTNHTRRPDPGGPPGATRRFTAIEARLESVGVLLPRCDWPATNSPLRFVQSLDICSDATHSIDC